MLPKSDIIRSIFEYRVLLLFKDLNPKAKTEHKAKITDIIL